MPNQFTASLWGDEGFSAILSMKTIPQILQIIARDTSPPLYNITEHLAFQMFGTSEVVIRSLSFFYYLLACVFVFLLVKHFFGKKTALLATLLTFFNPFFFIYAFEGRMYAILALGVCASMYFFVTKRWFGYVVATAWALYSHHFAIFALFVQGGWFLWEVITALTTKRKKDHRKGVLQMFLAFVAVGIVYSPWLIPLYNQTKMVTGGFWLATPTLPDLRELIYKYLATGISHSLSQTTLYVVLILLALRDWLKNKRQSFFLLSWFLGPILITWLLSQKIQSIFYDRYLLFSIPPAMILLASNTRKYIGLALVVVLLAFMQIDFHYFTHPTKRPFKELSSYVLDVKRGDDYLINWNSSAHHLWETKYYKIPAPIYIANANSPDALPFFVGTALMEKDDITSKIPTTPYRIGVITSGPIDEVNLAGYTKGEAKTFGDLKFIWMENNKYYHLKDTNGKKVIR